MRTRDWLRRFDKASAWLQPAIPETPLVRRVRTERQAQTEARTRDAERRARAAAVHLPDLDAEIQINAAVSIGLKHRITVYGMTGVGKTTWVRQLIPRLRLWYERLPVNIIDSKGYHEYDDMAARLHVGPEAPEPAKPGEVVVWVIPGAVPLEELDKFLKAILTTGLPCVTVADEITNFGTGGVFVEGLDLMLKQGRFSGMLFVAMGQQFAGNTRNLFGQTTHVLRFHLLNLYDSRELNKVMGIPTRPGHQAVEPPLPYGFFYRRVDRPSPVFAYSGWQEFFRF